MSERIFWGHAICRPKPTMLRIACSDPRFRIAFKGFTIEHLGFQPGQFVPIDIGGGPAALAHEILLNRDFDFLMSQIKFFLGHFPTIKTVVLIGHQDCGYYKTIPDHPDLKDKEKRDLPRAVNSLRSRLSDDVQVLAYYASLEYERIAFEDILELATV